MNTKPTIEELKKQGWKINPAYVNATHWDLLVYPGCPSFHEQIQKNLQISRVLEKFIEASDFAIDNRAQHA